MIFYDVYFELCLGIGKTPNEVAREIGIETSSLRKWRKRKQKIPSGEILNQVAVYFGLNRYEMIRKLDRLLDHVDSNSKFPKRLKLLRKFSCLSQTQLAKQFELSDKAISAYESGSRTPPVENLIQLADFFDVDLNFLLGTSDDPAPSNAIRKGKTRDGICRGNIIRYRRESLGYTIEQLAGTCQITEAELRTIESGYDITLSSTQIKALTQALLFSAESNIRFPCAE